MANNEIYKKLSDAVVIGDQASTKTYAEEALKAGIDPLDAIENGLSRGMKIVGNKFMNGELFLPEMLMAADAFNAAMEVFKPAIEAGKKQLQSSGRVVLATVKGDIHAIGKNIVATVLETNGFEVIDLGVDQPSLEIIEQAKKNNADIIALSALMTTTMPGQKEVIDMLNELGLRQNFKVVVGGGPVNEEWAEEIGADGYGENAFQAVEVMSRILSIK